MFTKQFLVFIITVESKDIMGRIKGSKNGVVGHGINKKEFESLCGLLCTMEEIASFFNTTYATLLRWCKDNYEGQTFEEIWKQYSTVGKVSLRRAQFKLAQINSNMAIFLGKNYLGQTVEEDRANNTVQLINVQVIDATKQQDRVSQIENQITNQLVNINPKDSN